MTMLASCSKRPIRDWTESWDPVVTVESSTGDGTKTRGGGTVSADASSGEAVTDVRVGFLGDASKNSTASVSAPKRLIFMTTKLTINAARHTYARPTYLTWFYEKVGILSVQLRRLLDLGGSERPSQIIPALTAPLNWEPTRTRRYVQISDYFLFH